MTKSFILSYTLLADAITDARGDIQHAALPQSKYKDLVKTQLSLKSLIGETTLAERHLVQFSHKD